MATISGAVGGFVGLAGFLPDAAVTTIAIMREIASIARANGEDLTREDTRRACLEVFALRVQPPDAPSAAPPPRGGEAGQPAPGPIRRGEAGPDDEPGGEWGYYATRLAFQGQPLVTLLSSVASRYGIQPQLIDDTLYDAFGQRQVTQYFTQINTYQVVLEVLPALASDPATLSKLYVRSPVSGQMVPLSAFAKWTTAPLQPLSISHQGQFPAITISFNLAPGVALGQATDAIQKAMQELQIPISLRSDILAVCWPILGVITVLQTAWMILKSMRRYRGFKA